MKRFLLTLPLSLMISAAAWADTDAPVDPQLDGIADEDDDSDDGDEDDLDDFLDDILSEPNEGESVEDEVDSVRSGELEYETESEVLLDDQRPEKRIIKTLQKKSFLKLHRFELTPNVAFVTNDPFLNRYIVGMNLGYHFTEVFEVEGNLGFSPNLGEADWKPLTKQLVENNHVSPDLSPLSYFGNVTFGYSPIYGKLAVLGRRIINFDIFADFGMGVVRTADDLDALQANNDPYALATQFQIHPTTNFGGGLRVIFNKSVAFRIEGKSLVYIETVSSTTLEMKNNFILQGGVSFFIPGMD